MLRHPLAKPSQDRYAGCTSAVQRTGRCQRRARSTYGDQPVPSGEHVRQRRGFDRAANQSWRLTALRTRSECPSRGASPHPERARDMSQTTMCETLPEQQTAQPLAPKLSWPLPTRARLRSPCPCLLGSAALPIRALGFGVRTRAAACGEQCGTARKRAHVGSGFPTRNTLAWSRHVKFPSLGSGVLSGSPAEKASASSLCSGVSPGGLVAASR